MSSDERTTPVTLSVQCPECSGLGFLVRVGAPPGTHEGERCGLCNGDKLVSLEVARAWRVAHAP